MSKKILQEQIMTLLEDITNQTNIVNNYDKQIPQIEIDIIMSNVRKLYTSFQKLNTLNFAISSPEEKKQAPSTKEEEKQQVEQQKTVSQLPVEKEEKQEEEIPQKMENNTQEQVKLGLFEEEKVVGDTIQEENQQALVNEVIRTDKEDISIGSKMQNNAINDIRKAIGLNEKFLFINELFSGNNDAFNIHIDKLNNCENTKQANMYLENLSQEYHWEAENTVKEKFYQIVERRFI